MGYFSIMAPSWKMVPGGMAMPDIEIMSDKARDGTIFAGVNVGVSIIGESPIAGWFISWKIPSRNGWWGVPLFQETSMSFFFGINAQYLLELISAFLLGDVKHGDVNPNPCGPWQNYVSHWMIIGWIASDSSMFQVPRWWNLSDFKRLPGCITIINSYTIIYNHQFPWVFVMLTYFYSLESQTFQTVHWQFRGLEGMPQINWGGNGGFHSHWGYPFMAGWFISGKSLYKWMIFRATPMTQPPNRLKSLFRPGFLAAGLGPFTVAAQRLLRTSPSERSGAENHPTERGRRVGDEFKKKCWQTLRDLMMIQSSLKWWSMMIKW